MSGAIAIFAKTPGLTPAKTRLAATLGTAAAEEFYRLALEAVEVTVAQALDRHPEWTARWAVAEAHGIDDPRWAGFGAQHTGEGDLGTRMARTYEGLRRAHGRAILIGADAPQMTAGHLETAIYMLEAQDFVVGPASDGGFWLIGGRVPIPAEVWGHPRYSGPHALGDLLASMQTAGLPRPARLATLSDVDELADLTAMCAEMPPDPTVPQRACIAWAGAHLDGRPAGEADGRPSAR